MKKLVVVALLIPSALAASAAEGPAVPAPAELAPASATAAAPLQPELAVVLGVPAPRLVNQCNDICISDFKICRDSCRSLACYNQCRDALNVCSAGC